MHIRQIGIHVFTVFLYLLFSSDPAFSEEWNCTLKEKGGKSTPLRYDSWEIGGYTSAAVRLRFPDQPDLYFLWTSQTKDLCGHYEVFGKSGDNTRGPHRLERAPQISLEVCSRLGGRPTFLIRNGHRSEVACLKWTTWRGSGEGKPE